jgi:hypothetical protein
MSLLLTTLRESQKRWCKREDSTIWEGLGLLHGQRKVPKDTWAQYCRVLLIDWIGSDERVPDGRTTPTEGEGSALKPDPWLDLKEGVDKDPGMRSRALLIPIADCCGTCEIL